MQLRFFAKGGSEGATEKEAHKDLSKFVKNQFKELAKKNLSIPVRLYTL
jgi:hypothetical protein